MSQASADVLRKLKMVDHTVGRQEWLRDMGAECDLLGKTLSTVTRLFEKGDEP